MTFKIVEQNYKNECGLCILTSFHNYYYPELNLNKQQLYDNYSFNVNGMSVYELEVLGSKIGLQLNSYELPFDEFIKLENNYYITTINQNDLNHFVVIKKDKYQIELIDTDYNTKKYSYGEFEQIYKNILITVAKKEIDNYTFLANKNSKLNFDYPNMYGLVFLIVFVDIVSMLLSIVCNGFIKIVIDKIIPLQMVEELFYLSMFFVISYLVNFLLNYILSFMKIRKYELIFKNHIVFYTKVLKNKSKSYFDKFEKEIIYEHPNAISHIILNKYFEIPELISNSIIITTLLLVVLFSSYWFIIPVFINLIFVIVFGMIKFKNNNDNYVYLHINKNKIEINYNNFYSFLMNEKNNDKLKTIENNWHKELWDYQKHNKQNSKFNLTIDLFDNSITKFVFIMFISICSYFIINQFDKSLSISTVIFLISILNMLNTSFNEVFNYLCSIPLYKKSFKILDDFLSIDNKPNDVDGLKIKQIKNIKIKSLNFSYNNKTVFENYDCELLNGCLLVGKNGVGKSTLLKIIGQDYYELTKNNILLNEIKIDKLNHSYLDNQIIYLPADSIVTQQDLTSIVHSNADNKQLCIKILKETQLNFANKEFSKGEKQLLNMISLINLKNKIILLDESFSNVNNKFDKLIYSTFKKHLEKNNFVLWVSHNQRIYKYFNKRININGR